MFTTDLYIRIGVNRFRARNLGTGAATERIPNSNFSHPRMLVGNFTEAQIAVKAAVAEVRATALFECAANRHAPTGDTRRWPFAS